MSLLEKALKIIEESKVQSEEKITPREKKISAAKKIPDVKKVSKSVLTPKDKVCPTCNKKHTIFQDKNMSKNEIINWFTIYLVENKDRFTLDWLRGQKLTFESVNEMRK